MSCFWLSAEKAPCIYRKMLRENEVYKHKQNNKSAVVCAGTLGVYDLVFDMTGIDLSTTTKEDLHKEHVDRSASVIAFTPEAQEVMHISDKVFADPTFFVVFCIPP